MVELTLHERRKVAVKKILSLGFSAVCGFGLARRFAKPAVTIVVYHRIISDGHSGVCPYISVTETNLRDQIRFFKKHYQLITLEKAVDLLSAGYLDKQYLVVTFDDGYEDNYTLGMRIFAEEAIRPTVFVTTDCVARGKTLWPDRLRHIIYSAVVIQPIVIIKSNCLIGKSLTERITALKYLIAHGKGLSMIEREVFIQELANKFKVTEQCPPQMLDSEQVKLLTEHGVSIGAHTVNHPVLSKVSAEIAEREIKESKRALEKWTGRDIVTFAYPNGKSEDFTELTVGQLQSAGYVAAVTTMRGVNKHGCDLFRLRRTGIYLTDSLAVIKMKLAIESLL